MRAPAHHALQSAITTSVSRRSHQFRVTAQHLMTLGHLCMTARTSREQDRSECNASLMLSDERCTPPGATAATFRAPTVYMCCAIAVAPCRFQVLQLGLSGSGCRICTC